MNAILNGSAWARRHARLLSEGMWQGNCPCGTAASTSTPSPTGRGWRNHLHHLWALLTAHSRDAGSHHCEVEPPVAPTATGSHCSQVEPLVELMTGGPRAQRPCLAAGSSLPAAALGAPPKKPASKGRTHQRNQVELGWMMGMRSRSVTQAKAVSRRQEEPGRWDSRRLRRLFCGQEWAGMGSEMGACAYQAGSTHAQPPSACPAQAVPISQYQYISQMSHIPTKQGTQAAPGWCAPRSRRCCCCASSCSGASCPC